MHTPIAPLVAAAVGLIALAACTQTQERVSGAGVGAATGAAVGGPVGAVVGGVAGAATGPTVASAAGVPRAGTTATVKRKKVRRTRTTQPY
ncbi:hypothetical protein [Alsobacter sp. R-9]